LTWPGQTGTLSAPIIGAHCTIKLASETSKSGLLPYC
jgi:hypothetical protein